MTLVAGCVSRGSPPLRRSDGILRSRDGSEWQGSKGVHRTAARLTDSGARKDYSMLVQRQRNCRSPAGQV